MAADDDQDNNVDDQEVDTEDENLDGEESAGEEQDNAAESDEDADAGEADDDESSDASDDADGSTEDDAEEEDEVDPVGLAIMRSVGAGAPQDESFDIRKLPRDENGLIDPVAANKAVQEWAGKRAEAQTNEDKQLNEVRTTLNAQWMAGAKKYEHIWKNKDMREMARNFHLSSFENARNGTGAYLSPAAALKKVDRMYKGAFKSGATSQKIRKRVISRAGTERGGTGDSSQGKSDEYDNLKKMAGSRDPVKAREGRQRLLIYRRNARLAQ